MVHPLAAATPVGSVPDLLRLLAVPAFAWAAHRDLRTRRVPNRTWPPLLLLGVVALAWDALVAFGGPSFLGRLFLLRVGVSLGVVAPLGYLFWRLGGFGGADAKALVTLAVLFPTYPTYYVGGTILPLARSAVGAFSLTVLTNAVLVGLAYPLALAVRNLADGRVSPLAFVGKPVTSDAVEREYGRLLRTTSGVGRNGLDLDALRMYLRWRGTSLAALRADPETHRDPRSLPGTPNDPGDGSLADFEGPPIAASAADGGTLASRSSSASSALPPDSPSERAAADPWGAAAFLASIEGDAYGTTPDRLRAGLDALVEEDEVWITPGLPFLVPTFVGLVVGLVVGDLLFLALTAIGLA
ncbi:A24 family peptidase [Halomarina pelagica]|uniref:A24 family peptidase n=1 Tax=Halomarina pelagica TaxID=2961599 RepID=UPI0020C23C98|nr:A24 family peptidase [Halomarina sp. BND7]